MSCEIVNAAHDENGRYTGGAAGDQSGGEVLRRPWYNRPWNIIERPIHKQVGEQVAAVAKLLAANPNIGYDQSERTSLYKEGSRIGWNPSRIGEIGPCECDCSSLIAVVLRFVGIEIPETVWTGSLDTCLRSTGNFAPITDQATLSSGVRLRAGDILINSRYHAAVVVSSGEDAPRPAWYTARVTASDYLQIRTAPAVTAEEYKISGYSQRLPTNAWIIVCEETESWARIYDFNGWVFKGYLRRG